MRIITSQKHVSTPGVAGTLGIEGKLWRYPPITKQNIYGSINWIGKFSVEDDLIEMPMPFGVQGILRRPSWRNYNIGQRSRLLGAGAWTANVMVDELMRALRQGIPAPSLVPTVAASAGPGTSGDAVCYLRFLDSRGGRVSPKSAPSVTVTLVNQGRLWGGAAGTAAALPTTCVDSSVDSLQGLVSMDGATPRVAWTRQLGVTTVTENTATLALGDADPGEFTDLPLGGINEIYHERQWVAMNERYPQRAFASGLGELERYEGLYVDTDGEWINGMFTQNDLLFLGTRHKIDRIAGYSPGDMSREIEKPDVGIIGHHGIVNMHKRSIVPTTTGIQMYDGQWHFLMDDRRVEWVSGYASYRAAYEAAQGFWHPLRNVYMFGPIPYGGTQNAFWVLDAKRLTPEIEADEFGVFWANDVRHKQDEPVPPTAPLPPQHFDTTRATFFLPGSAQPQVACGTTYGKLLDDFTYGYGDDGYRFDVTIAPAPLHPDQGGGQRDANQFHRLWVYAKSPYNTYVVYTQGLSAGATGAAGQGPEVAITPDDLERTTAAESKALLLKRCAGESFALTIGVPGFQSHPIYGTQHIRGAIAFCGYGVTYGPGVRARANFDPSGGGGG